MYYIQGILHEQNDICGFIGVMGLTCLIKLISFLYLITARMLTSMPVVKLAAEEGGVVTVVLC